MEHRHSPRKPVNVAVTILANEGDPYPAQLIDLSASGMRLVIKDSLPERIKVVDVVLPGPADVPGSARSVRMFVAWKQGRELGLCLVNERIKIDDEWCRTEVQEFVTLRKAAY